MTQTEPFLYERVSGQVRQLIDDGVLRVGERVPSIRKMSASSGVSVATVMQAYEMLEREGVIESRPKSGFFVTAALQTLPIPEAAKPHLSPRKVQVGDLLEETMAAAYEPGMIGFSDARPSPSLLPGAALRRAMHRANQRHGDRVLDYSEPLGAYELRRQIAGRSAMHGSRVPMDDIIITNGATEALTIALKSVTQPGDVVAVESPTYHAVLRIIEQLGCMALEVQTDPQTGMSVESLALAVERVDVRAVLATPNFGNPLGSLMPRESKRAIVEMLSRRRIAFIEDDIFGDLHFESERPGLAREFDSDGWVLSCSSFSKTLAPGYRVGWLMPGRFAREAAGWKRALSLSTASVLQLAIAEFLAQGGYERLLRSLRTSYRQQVELARLAIARFFPEGTRVTRPQGGLVLWVELPSQVDGQQLFHDALAERISIIPGALFSPTRKYRNYIRIACGNPWTEESERAMQTLGVLASRQL